MWDVFPRHWEVMRADYDRTLCKLFEKAVLAQVPLVNFVRQYFLAITLYVDGEHLKHLFDCVEKKLDPPISILWMVL